MRVNPLWTRVNRNLIIILENKDSRRDFGLEIIIGERLIEIEKQDSWQNTKNMIGYYCP